MKNLIKNYFFGLVGLTLLCLCSSATFAGTVTDKANCYRPDKPVLKAVAVAEVYNIFHIMAFAETPSVIELPEIYAVQVWPVPVNDAKPDNTNYQIIRHKQLKLHVAGNDRSC